MTANFVAPPLGGDLREDAITEHIARAAAGTVLFLCSAPLASNSDSFPESKKADTLRSLLGQYGALEENIHVFSGEITGESDAILKAGISDHVVRWTYAGDIFERLLSAASGHFNPDYVFCLDPWIACLRTPATKIFPASSWILVSDFERRAQKEDRAYWAEMKAWIDRLGFDAILNEEALLPRPHASRNEAEPNAKGDSAAFFRGSPSGSTSQSRRTHRRFNPVLSILGFVTGSLSHLRIFVESVARQTLPLETISVFLLYERGDAHITRLLKNFRITHPKLQILMPDLTSPAEGSPSHETFRKLIEGLAPTILALDTDLVPGNTAFESLKCRGGEAKARLLSSATLGTDISAQIISGNLDPYAHAHFLRRHAIEEGASRLQNDVRAVSGLFDRTHLLQSVSSHAPSSVTELRDLIRSLLLESVTVPEGVETFLRLEEIEGS